MNIPDANFKAYLVGNTLINTNAYTEIQVSEATAYTGEIDFVNSSISDLTGLETFTALTYLGCSYNNITSLDVSNNIALTQLFCYNNQLTSLDVTQNTALTDLNCGNNQLTSLDVSSNTALTELYCYNNQLICLNVKNGNNLNFTVSAFLGAGLNATQNPNLICIDVDDFAWSNANWTVANSSIDFQTTFSADCNNNNCSSVVGIEELSNTPKQLVKIVDVIGRETTFKPNTPLIYIYSDGKTEKVFKMGE